MYEAIDNTMATLHERGLTASITAIKRQGQWYVNLRAFPYGLSLSSMAPKLSEALDDLNTQCRNNAD